MIKFAHLSAGFMLTSIIGVLVSFYFIMKISNTWGFTFALFFGLMFVASIISMTHAPYSKAEYQEELAIHNKSLKKSVKKK